MRLAKLRRLVPVLALLVAVVASTSPARAFTGVSFEFFHSNLSHHGSWHVSASYGEVWQPARVVHDWHPYAYGHWVYTDYGWTWVSDYAWGAIPFHYGTWVIEPGLGWVWVPGYVWAPAWVVYRTGPDYIGWAPVPVGFSVGFSFSSYHYEPDYFLFVRERDFCERDLRRYAVPHARTNVVYQQTNIINNITIDNRVVVNRGIDVRHVERVASRRPERLSVERVPRIAPVDRVSREVLQVDARQAERGRVEVVDRERLPRERRLEIEARDRDDRRPIARPDGAVSPGTAPSSDDERDRARTQRDRNGEPQRERAGQQEQDRERARRVNEERNHAADRERDRADRGDERVREQQHVEQQRELERARERARGVEQDQDRQVQRAQQQEREHERAVQQDRGRQQQRDQERAQQQRDRDADRAMQQDRERQQQRSAREQERARDRQERDRQERLEQERAVREQDRALRDQQERARDRAVQQERGRQEQREQDRAANEQERAREQQERATQQQRDQQRQNDQEHAAREQERAQQQQRAQQEQAQQQQRGQQEQAREGGRGHGGRRGGDDAETLPPGRDERGG